MLNVICVKWGTKYNHDYVNKLYNMTQRRLNYEHRFICLTDNPAGIDPIIESLPFPEDDTGWWNKLNLFRPYLHDIEGTILYMDLDVVLVDSIDPLINYKGRNFCIIDDWLPQFHHNSSVMRFEFGSQPHIWTNYEEKKGLIRQNYRGDQEWISRHVPDATTWPEGWCFSYKWGAKLKALNKPGVVPANGKIGVFAGRPKQDEVSDLWVKRNWK